MRSDVKHFLCEIEDGIATVRLDRPDRKNPLTFDSYAELRDWFRDMVYADDVDVVIFGSNGGNFSSGGDVHDIIGPLTRMNMKELLQFTRGMHLGVGGDDAFHQCGAGARLAEHENGGLVLVACGQPGEPVLRIV